jgi:hypothetical protein
MPTGTYTQSAAQSGSQTLFKINTGTVATPAYTVISEVIDFSQSGKSNKTADVTNLQSAGEEFIATLLSPGKYDLTYNRVVADAGQAAVLASFNAKTTVMYSIELPKTTAQTSTGDTYKFNAIVEGMDDLSSVSPTKQLTSKASLKVSGAITFTQGS